MASKYVGGVVGWNWRRLVKQQRKTLMCLEGNGDSAFNTLTHNGGASKKYSVNVCVSMYTKYQNVQVQQGREGKCATAACLCLLAAWKSFLSTLGGGRHSLFLFCISSQHFSLWLEAAVIIVLR